MGMSVRNLERALQRQQSERWRGMYLDDDGIRRYHPLPPMSKWVTMDPFVKLLIIALPVALLIAIIVTG